MAEEWKLHNGVIRCRWRKVTLKAAGPPCDKAKHGEAPTSGYPSGAYDAKSPVPLITKAKQAWAQALCMDSSSPNMQLPQAPCPWQEHLSRGPGNTTDESNSPAHYIHYAH